MIASGCEERNRVPVPEDRICPQCGRDIEVFLLKGRVMEEVVCECGYTIEAEDQIVTAADK